MNFLSHKEGHFELNQTKACTNILSVYIDNKFIRKWRCNLNSYAIHVTSFVQDWENRGKNNERGLKKERVKTKASLTERLQPLIYQQRIHRIPLSWKSNSSTSQDGFWSNALSRVWQIVAWPQRIGRSYHGKSAREGYVSKPSRGWRTCQASMHLSFAHFTGSVRVY